MGSFHKNKYDHALDQSPELLSIQEKVRSFIKLAQYKKAHKYLTKIYTKYPKSYYIPSMLATLNAEDAWVLSDKEMNKAFKIAATKLKKLLPFRFGASKKLQSQNLNEYLWFAQLHYEQFKFGKNQYKKGNTGGLYSMGVGSANLAYKLLLEGKHSRGINWAKKSQGIWEEYFLLVSKEYHDPWYWYSLSLGLQGMEAKSLKALNTSAKLAKLNLKNDPACKKLRRMCLEQIQKHKASQRI